VALLNPLTPDMAQLRTTLAGSMLEALAYNLNRKNPNNRFFEIGKVYEVTDKEGTVDERDILGILIEGNYVPAAWNASPVSSGFFILKGILETFASQTGIGIAFTQCDECGPIYESEMTSVRLGPSSAGTAGKIAAPIRAFFDIKPDCHYAQIDITDLLKTPPALPAYKGLPRFPALERDFCFVMDDGVGASALSSEIYGISKLVEEVYPFDVYRGEKLGAGKKSIAFSVKLRSPEKTLTDDEAEGICKEIIARMNSKFGAQLRS
jgi:phenylalanyl-tRNA synthetase beta chain